MEAPTKSHRVRWRVKWCLHKGHLFIAGLFMAILPAQGIAEQRYPKMTWFWLLLLPFWGWYLYAGWPRELTSESSECDVPPSAGVVLLWIPLYFVMYWQRAHVWAIVGIGTVSALVIALIIKDVYKSSPWLVFIGWTIAIPLAFLLKWPNGQRFMFVLMFGGLATAFYGLLFFGRALAKMRKPLRP